MAQTEEKTQDTVQDGQQKVQPAGEKWVYADGTEMSPADTEPPTAVEAGISLLIGGALVLIGWSLWAWGVRLSLSGFKSGVGWPPGLEKLLLPVALAALATGFGAWRMLKLGIPGKLFGLSLGWTVIAGFVVASVLGVLL